MKPVENKKHTPKYYPMEIYKIEVIAYCDVGSGDLPYTITRHLPLTALQGGNLCKKGAAIVVGTIEIEPKFFKQIRKRKE